MQLSFKGGTTTATTTHYSQSDDKEDNLQEIEGEGGAVAKAKKMSGFRRPIKVVNIAVSEVRAVSGGGAENCSSGGAFLIVLCVSKDRHIN